MSRAPQNRISRDVVIHTKALMAWKADILARREEKKKLSIQEKLRREKITKLLKKIGLKKRQNRIKPVLVPGGLGSKNRQRLKSFRPARK